MNRTVRKSVALGSSLLLLSLLAGCTPAFNSVRTGPLRTDTQTVEAKGATSARVDVVMGFGELTMGSGASDLAQANFTYNVDAWKPTVAYSLSDGKGNLAIKQPDANALNFGDARNVRNTWDVRLTSAIPLDLNVDLGAGTSQLNLSGLTLNSAKIDCGAGETTVDLTGSWAKDASISISGGVGKLTVRLPKDVGVRVKSDTGIGSTTTTDLNQDGNTYTNDAYGKSAVTLIVDISAGVGEVQLSVE